MRKLSVVVIALAVGLGGFAATAQAQQKRDQGTCTKLVKANPSLLRSGQCMGACRAANVRCMKGEQI